VATNAISQKHLIFSGAGGFDRDGFCPAIDWRAKWR